MSDWRDRGACVGHPEPDLWASTCVLERREALRICRGCAVCAECLEFATTLRLHGVWGATTSADRKHSGARPSTESPFATLDTALRRRAAEVAVRTGALSESAAAEQYRVAPLATVRARRHAHHLGETA